ncbi:MAG TPA: response regulator transcription factor [Candidatus Paceibacterota bacterium]
MKILIVEDDPSISEFIREGLEHDGYNVDTVFDGLKASYMAKTNHYDLIIMDYSLPQKNGYEVCKEIRASGLHMPIIFLSVLEDINKKIEVLEKGADDYLTKPFSFHELKARIKAQLRRQEKTDYQNKTLKLGELSIDISKRLAYKKNNPIYLTRKEYNLLEYLMKNQGIVVSRSMIMDHVWNAESDPFSNTVEAHILNLRKKILYDGKNHIHNIPGRGYIIDA